MALNRAAALTFTFRQSQHGYPFLICSCFLAETIVRVAGVQRRTRPEPRQKPHGVRSKGETPCGNTHIQSTGILGKAGIADDDSGVTHHPPGWTQRPVRTVKKRGLLSLLVQRETCWSSRFVSEQFSNLLIQHAEIKRRDAK
jgi:hypothetical protein